MLLEGLRVLDLTRLAPGPYCTMALGDMGADVLKVEETEGGDYMRTMGELLVAETPAYLMLNRNKKSIAINLKTEQGKQLLRQLIMTYDVLVEQFRPGVMERLGIGYEDLRKVNPRLIYCAITGYGQNGPYRDKVGHDPNYLAMAGVLDSISLPDGRPVRPGVLFGDFAAGGMWAVIGILSAAFHRERSGQGQYIDVSMYDGLVSFLNLYASDFFRLGKNPKEEPKAAMNIYETKDGRYIMLAAAEPKFWVTLCRVLGREDLIPRQNDPEPQQGEIREIFKQIFLTKTQAEWTEILLPHDTMYAPVKTIEEVFEDPHFKVRDMYWELEHPVEGRVKSIGFPVKFKEDPAKATLHPPLLGEHTDEVLKALGCSEDDISALKSQGIVK